MLVRVDVNHPPLLVYLDDPADDHVSNVGSVSLPEGPDTDHLVDLMDHSGHACVDLVVLWVLVCAVTSDEAFADVVAREDHLQFFLGCFLL